MNGTPGNETRGEKAEARAIRRRWINVGELVAVASVVIAGLTFWQNWSERREGEQEKARVTAQTSSQAAALDLKADVVEDGRQVALSDPRHDLLDVTVTFPRALAVSQRTPAVPRIEWDWFEEAVRKATDGGADDRQGHLPVLVRASYRDGDRSRTGMAIVDILWETNGRIVAHRGLRIIGARVRERGGSQARIDALWRQDLARAG